MKRLFKLFFLCGILIEFQWGFFAHQQINRLAVFTLPDEMMGFFKHNITYITEAAVNPDKRRYAVAEEGARHYIDLDHYGDSAVYKMPRFWSQAVSRYSEDTLQSYGILPWHIQRMYSRLKDAFLVRDPEKILKVSAELGHYLGDAHVPLHTTENYNGQLTNQHGIHGFWESRLPELYFNDYDFFVGGAVYIENVQLEAWKIIARSHFALDSVLQFEKRLADQFDERKYSFETKGNQTIKVYSKEFSKAYHQSLSGMVERQMRICVKNVGSFWYSAWVDAGQPDLTKLIDYAPTEEELKRNREEVEEWKVKRVKAREHENE